jgi:hypothetical protein
MQLLLHCAASHGLQGADSDTVRDARVLGWKVPDWGQGAATSREVDATLTDWAVYSCSNVLDGFGILASMCELRSCMFACVLNGSSRAVMDGRNGRLQAGLAGSCCRSVHTLHAAACAARHHHVARAGRRRCCYSLHTVLFLRPAYWL